MPWHPSLHRTPITASNPSPHVYHVLRYTLPVAHAISVRLDDESLRALRQIEAQGLTQSEAVRSSLVHEAARVRDRQALAAEVAVLEADESDRAEMSAVASLMEQLRAPR